MNVSIEDLAYGFKLLKARCTGVAPRGAQKAKVTLKFHQGGVVLALYPFSHERSETHQSNHGCVARVPTWRFPPLAPPSSPLRETEPVIQTSAPFEFCCASFVRGHIFGTGLLALLPVLLLPLIHALLIVGHAVSLAVLMCCGCVWLPNAPSRSPSDLCSFQS